ncbi:MAG: hypothetical protein AB8B58_16425 [Roseobacter sp.]
MTSVAAGADFTFSAPQAHDVTVLPMENPHGEILPRYFIHLDGPIERGDAEKLDRMIMRDILNYESGDDYPLNAVAGWGQIVLSLDSGGGELTAGIELSDVIRKRNIATLIEADAKCLSACAVAFMAGYEHLEESEPQRMRFVQWPGRLGFHRPFIDQSLALDASMITDLSKDEAAMMVAAIQTMFDSQFREAFEVANDKIQEILDVDPDSWSTDLLMRMLNETDRNAFVEIETVGDALDWGIRVINVSSPPESGEDLPRTLFWLCYNSVPPTEAARRGWIGQKGFDDLDEFFFDGDISYWLTETRVDEGFTQYVVTMEQLNGTGCSMDVFKEDGYPLVAEVDGLFFPFSEGYGRLHGHNRSLSLQEVAQ